MKSWRHLEYSLHRLTAIQSISSASMNVQNRVNLNDILNHYSGPCRLWINGLIIQNVGARRLTASLSWRHMPNEQSKKQLRNTTRADLLRIDATVERPRRLKIFLHALLQWSRYVVSPEEILQISSLGLVDGSSSVHALYDRRYVTEHQSVH